MREILNIGFQDMLLLSCTVASHYYNCCTGGINSPGNYGYHPIHDIQWNLQYFWAALMWKKTFKTVFNSILVLHNLAVGLITVIIFSFSKNDYCLIIHIPCFNVKKSVIFMWIIFMCLVCFWEQTFAVNIKLQSLWSTSCSYCMASLRQYEQTLLPHFCRTLSVPSQPNKSPSPQCDTWADAEQKTELAAPPRPGTDHSDANCTLPYSGNLIFTARCVSIRWQQLLATLLTNCTLQSVAFRLWDSTISWQYAVLGSSVHIIDTWGRMKEEEFLGHLSNS
jgi:hypothetical protein